jgi:hypothetical protein
MNALTKAIENLQRVVLSTVKQRIVQEGPQILIAFYNDFLQPSTVPDRQAKKSKRLYFSQPNTSNKLRTQYGNIQRALQEGEIGNITEVVIKNDTVSFISGINEQATVQAGPDRITLEYARFHEEGTKNFRARPFLNPGFALFMKEGYPDIIEQIERDLLKAFNRGS